MSQHTNTPEDIKPFTVRFPKPLGRRLAMAAVTHDTTKQAIVQQAVEKHLTKLELALEIKGAKRNG